MTYSAEALQHLRDEFATIPQKNQDLWDSYLRRDYEVVRTKEFAQHGFLRRVGIMARCIANVFENIPPDLEDIPNTDIRHDAEINIQSSVFNTFGATDNLAWIWVKERAITRQNGRQLRNTDVGLRQANAFVRQSFSADFREYLESLDPWFDHLENFRHALAHRIPLYIPPYVVTRDNQEAYADLERRRMESLFQRNDVAEHERLKEEQDRLRIFKAWMMHSFEEDGRQVAFHAQLLANFNTIHELGQKLLDELNRAH